MSGHSKWSTIKHKKAAEDAKRSKAFSIVSKMIMIAAKEGASGDPNQNPRLRMALEKARDVNMPKANIQKAIDRGLGKDGGASVEEIVYEGYGPGGVGYIVKALTDNRNRTGSEVRSMFDKSGGSLGGPNAVMFMFERDGENLKATITVPADDSTKTQNERLIEQLEEHEDVEFVVTNMA